MPRAHADRVRQGIQRQRFFGLDNQFARFGNDRRLFIMSGEIVRFAALAGTKSRSLCVLRRVVKDYVFAEREACRAGRTAVDPRGLHGIDERVVGILVPTGHRLPAFRVD